MHACTRARARARSLMHALTPLRARTHAQAHACKAVGGADDAIADHRWSDTGANTGNCGTDTSAATARCNTLGIKTDMLLQLTWYYI